MAIACELMCQPSASSAIELNHQPAAISTTIMTAVIHMTTLVPRSATALPSSNTWLWVQAERLCSTLFIYLPSQEGSVRNEIYTCGKHHIQQPEPGKARTAQRVTF